VTDWDSLKLGLSIQILPGNVQDIRLDCSSHDLKTSDLILCLTCRRAIDPGSVRNNGFSFWLHRVYAFEPDMRTRRARVRISMDLSVISVVLVSSRTIRGLISMNLIIKGVLLLLIVVINSLCGELIATP
jgi:hypothetical protein